MPSIRCGHHRWRACTNLALFFCLSGAVSAASSNIADVHNEPGISVDVIDFKTLPKPSWSVRIGQSTLKYEDALKTALLFVALLALVVLVICIEKKAGEKKGLSKLKELELELSKKLEQAYKEKGELELELHQASEDLKEALLNRAVLIRDLITKEKEAFLDHRDKIKIGEDAITEEIGIDEETIAELKKRLRSIKDRELLLRESDMSRRAQEGALVRLMNEFARIMCEVLSHNRACTKA